MKILGKIWRILMRGFATTTAISLFMYSVVTLSTSYDSMRFKDYLLILGFSILIALSFELLFIRSLPFLVRILMQYLALMISFIVLFISSGNIESSVGTIIIFVFCFTLVFTILTAIIFPLLKVAGYYEKYLAYQPETNASGEKTPYQSRF